MPHKHHLRSALYSDSLRHMAMGKWMRLRRSELFIIGKSIVRDVISSLSLSPTLSISMELKKNASEMRCMLPLVTKTCLESFTASTAIGLFRCHHTRFSDRLPRVQASGLNRNSCFIIGSRSDIQINEIN